MITAVAKPCNHERIEWYVDIGWTLVERETSIGSCFHCGVWLARFKDNDSFTYRPLKGLEKALAEELLFGKGQWYRVAQGLKRRVEMSDGTVTD